MKIQNKQMTNARTALVLSIRGHLPIIIIAIGIAITSPMRIVQPTTNQ